MLNNRFTKVLAMLCTLFSQTACAFFDPPYITPENPVASETISVNIRGGICDAIVGIPGYPQITQEGNAIRILFWSASYTDPILCNIPVGTATYAVGAYPVGSYTLQVDREYFGDLGGILTERLGTIPFTVSSVGTPPVDALALDDVGVGVLGFSIVLVALLGLRRSRSIGLAVALAALPLGTRAEVAEPPNHVVEPLFTTAPGAPTGSAERPSL
jgi:hypothetical protein